MNSYYQTDLSGFNFEYLRGTRFQSVYDILNVAKDLNEVDKGSCCTKLRYALEIVISEVIAICDLKSYKRKNINGRINRWFNFFICKFFNKQKKVKLVIVGGYLSWGC